MGQFHKKSRVDPTEVENLNGFRPTLEQKRYSATVHFVNKDTVRFTFGSWRRMGHNFVAGVWREPFCPPSAPTPTPPTPIPTPPPCPYPLDHRVVSFNFDEFQVINKTAGRFNDVLKSPDPWLDLIVVTTDDSGTQKETELLNSIEGLGLYADFFFKEDEPLWVTMYLVERGTNKVTSLSSLENVVYDIGGSENVLAEGCASYHVESAVTSERNGDWVTFTKKSGVEPNEVENLNGTKPTLEQKKYSARARFVYKDIVRFTFGSWMRMGHNFVAGVWREPFCPPSEPTPPPTPPPCPYRLDQRAVDFDLTEFKVISKTAGRFSNVLRSSGEWLDLIVETSDDASGRKQTELVNSIEGLGPYADFFFKEDEALWVTIYLVERGTHKRTSLSSLVYVVYDIGELESVMTRGFVSYHVGSVVTVERKGLWVNFTKKSEVEDNEVENLNGNRPTEEQKKYSARVHFEDQDSVRFRFGSWRREGHNFVAGQWREHLCCPYPFSERRIDFNFGKFEIISMYSGRFSNVLRSSGEWLDLMVVATYDASRRKQTELLNSIKGLGPYVDFFKKDEPLWVTMYLVERGTHKRTSLSSLVYVVYDIGRSENVLAEGCASYHVESAVIAERNGDWVNFTKSGAGPNEVLNLEGSPTEFQKKYSATVHFVEQKTVRFRFGSWMRRGHNFVAGMWAKCEFAS